VAGICLEYSYLLRVDSLRRCDCRSGAKLFLGCFCSGELVEFFGDVCRRRDRCCAPGLPRLIQEVSAVLAHKLAPGVSWVVWVVVTLGSGCGETLLLAERGADKLPHGTTLERGEHSRYQSQVSPGHRVDRDHYCMSKAPYLGPSICFSRVYLGAYPGCVYYRQDVWATSCPSVPPCCCHPHLAPYYHYYWYRPSVIYFDPAAPLLRDLAAVTNRYMGSTRANLEQDLRGPRADLRANAPQQDEAPIGDKQNMRGLTVAEPIKFRPSNEQQRDLANRFLSFGDRCFSSGQYRDAYFKYKEAEKAAPDVAESLFRQGFALLATKQYELAFHAFRRGLRMDPTWPKKPVFLLRLYAERQGDLREHLASLAEECEKRNHEGTLALLLGIMLFCADRAVDAREFFEIARSSPTSAELAALFSNKGG